MIILILGAPNITTPPVSATVEAPQPAVFTCSAVGSPVPTISWLRIALDGSETVILEGGNIMISESSVGFTVTSSLTLSSTDINLNGVYVCIANTTQGTVNASAMLTINGNSGSNVIHDLFYISGSEYSTSIVTQFKIMLCVQIPLP